MSLVLGRRPICDFDGTIAVLPVAWAELRRALCLQSIGDLWADAEHPGWALVTAAEREAATRARRIKPVIQQLAGVEAFAVLTNNDELAVATALAATPELTGVDRVVVGRSSLRGPKFDFATFRQGFEACREFLQLEPSELVYVGDQAYELEHAQRLGARTVAAPPLERRGAL